MDGAAVYSKRLLDTYDKAAELKAQEQEAAAKYSLRSGQFVSSQPYGLVREKKKEMESMGTSDALIELQNDVRMANDYSGERSAQKQPAHQSPALYPASSATGPGEDGARQIATLQARLAQRLGPEYISSRQGPGGGGKLSYLEGWKAIDLANEVFGFNGWSSAVVRMDVDFLDEVEGKRYNVGVSAIVRITLRDGTYHEDLGFGHCENVKMKHMALEKARKEATTDALKRALRTFGRLLGNCLYDKKFVETASKMKAAPPKYDVSQLKRHDSLPKESPPLRVIPSAAEPAAPEDPQAAQPQQSPQSFRAARQDEPRGHGRARSTPIQSIIDVQLKSEVSAPGGELTPPSDVQMSEESRLREERKAMAAAKQAALRQRKEEEARARKEAGNRTVASSLAKTTFEQDRVLKGGLSPQQEKAFRDESIMHDESHTSGLDEYDLALAEAGNDDEEDDVSMEQEGVSRPVLQASKSVNLNNYMTDDSGIFIVEDTKKTRYSHHPVNALTKSGRRSVPPSSSTTHPMQNDRGLPIPCPVSMRNSATTGSSASSWHGRRLSIVGTSTSPTALQEQEQPVHWSQRIKQLTIAANEHRSAPLANKRPAQNQNDTVKKLRQSQTSRRF
ncbi:hypothetical protein CBS101457_006170 [Exobasidium rhododendri]|nr:hypothetical protein CBS101457_006170 [Exobasidium rhododendri]